MKRFICSGCYKKRNIKFLAVEVKFILGDYKNLCVDCWENKFNCDKSRLIIIKPNYENIILNKKDGLPGGHLKK